MALSANTWYVVTFTTPIPANTPPWVVATTIPNVITTAILTAASLRVFCLAAGTTATIIAAGIGPTDLPDAVMTVSATPAMNTQAMDNGATWYSIRNGVEWIWYDDIAGVVSTLADSSTLGAFIA